MKAILLVEQDIIEDRIVTNIIYYIYGTYTHTAQVYIITFTFIF